MRISTRTRYGSRALTELALAYPRAVSVKTVARNQRLSMKYLEHITAALKAAGLIKAVRGTRGGYALARPPADVNLGEVFRVLEGAPLVVECVENPRVCPRNSFCPTRDTWVEMRDAIQGVLDGTTLASLAERAREKASEPCVSYEI